MTPLVCQLPNWSKTPCGLDQTVVFYWGNEEKPTLKDNFFDFAQVSQFAQWEEDIWNGILEDPQFKALAEMRGLDFESLTETEPEDWRPVDKLDEPPV
jgi:hypothetical protein